MLVGFEKILKNEFVHYMINPNTNDEVFIDTIIVTASILEGELDRIHFPQEIFDSLYLKEEKMASKKS